jgi:hypothetical protein
MREKYILHNEKSKAAFYATSIPIWRLPTVKGHGVGLIIKILCLHPQLRDLCCLDDRISS